MLVDDFDFELDDSLIALRPNPQPEQAKMLLVDGSDGAIDDFVVANIVDKLHVGDCLILNNTKVIKSFLQGVRIRVESEAKISINLNKCHDNNSNIWSAFAKPMRRLKIGDKIYFDDGIIASVLQKHEMQVDLEFNRKGDEFDNFLQSQGQMPIPPYIASKRPIDAKDDTDYQCVFAKHNGSVAAPTAGLHFSKKILKQLQDKGVSIEYVTLHVGAGTFLPMKDGNVDDHKIHSEWGEVSQNTAKNLNKIRNNGGRIVCVGTTSLRILETCVDNNGVFHEFCGDTDIFIKPGFNFKACDILLTNFHLPKSSLFVLVCAFGGTYNMKKAYKHAVQSKYRFYSYGDCCFIYKKLTL